MLAAETTLSFGQNCNDWSYPEDRKTVDEKLVLYSDNRRNGNFKESAKHLHWLLVNTPGLHLSIYQNGSQIYEELANAETDPVQKRIYQDSSLLIYDLRIQFCGDEENVLNRKSLAAYHFYKDDKQRLGELYELFKKTFDLNGDNVWENILVAYMDVVRRYKAAGGNISDETVLKIYDEISGIIDNNIKKGEKAEKYEKYRETLFQILLLIIPLDCDFIDSNLVPKLRVNPDDFELSKRIVQLSVIAKCTDTDFFIDAAKKVQAREPSFGLAWAIGNRCLASEDFPCAIRFFEQSITLTNENGKKADLYYKLANIAFREDDYAGARELALKTVETDPSRLDAYSLIGKLYADSYEKCKGDVDRVKDRLVFIAAYEMFAKAGDEEGMKFSKEQFPSREELFERNYNAGQSMKITCWIRETVVLQTRD